MAVINSFKGFLFYCLSELSETALGNNVLNPWNEASEFMITHLVHCQ